MEIYAMVSSLSRSATNYLRNLFSYLCRKVLYLEF
jgi:hypothetical protein